MTPLDSPATPPAPPDSQPGAAPWPQPGGFHGGTLSIEQGYFVFTLMPSLFCRLRCPHCYLSLEQRQDPTIMALDQLEEACRKIDAYYRGRGIARKTIICYWYGGEPTSMGQDYFTRAAERINAVFTPQAGYDVRYTVLTALLTVDESWFPIFDHYGRGELQTSFDGLMRGKGYVRRWEAKAREAIAWGLRLSTISVVNRALIEAGPEDTLDYLAELGVAETSWLPFMLNEQNSAGSYGDFAPRMAEYSAFMQALTGHWLRRREQGRAAPEIGQMRFILGQRNMPLLSNIAGQTLFLLPNGDFVLPDYREGWQEFMQPFGNILKQDFEAVLTSPARRRYLRRQTLRNGNPECLDCPHIGHCLMEFWKDNRPGDDCFGARGYVEWLLARAGRIEPWLGGAPTLY